MKPSIRLSKSFLPFSLLGLISTTSAFPLIPRFQAARNLQPRNIEPRASYSVVAVDGSSSTGADTPAPTATATATATITNLITHTQTLLATQLSTIVVTESDSPTTIVVTVTSTSATTIVEPQPAAVDPTPPADPAPTTFITSPVTITVTDGTALPSTRPYDDGMWHTTYWYTASAPAAVTQVVASPGAMASAGWDSGSWQEWEGVTGGWRGPDRE